MRRLTIVFRVILISLWLCIAVMWARSYWRQDSLTLSAGSGDGTGGTVNLYWVAVSQHGSVFGGQLQIETASSAPLTFRLHGNRWGRLNLDVQSDPGAAMPASSLWQKLGFRKARSQQSFAGITITTRGIGAPYWLLQLLATIPAGLLVRRWRRGRRASYRRLHVLCLSCGYDLRATSDRCPECGAAAQPA